MKRYMKADNIICKLLGHRLELVNYENRIKGRKAYAEKHNKAVACRRCLYLHSWRECNERKRN